MSLTIYHNPRCSKSRQTLELIRQAGHEPDIRLYLENKLSAKEIDSLLSKLAFSSARELMRRGEAIYKELGLKTVSDEAILKQAMVDNPKLIERPIVVNGLKACLGRPPENVISLLNS